MAFIDEFRKYVVTDGQKVKIANKDNAIIALANEVVNGGGGGDQLPQVKSFWHYNPVTETYTKLEPTTPIGQKPQVFICNFTTKSDYLFISSSDGDIFDDGSIIGIGSYSETIGNEVLSRGINMQLAQFQYNDISQSISSDPDDTTNAIQMPKMYTNIWTTGSITGSGSDFVVGIICSPNIN